ncbi:PorT family protein [Polaribacter sp.]|nr:PorT family protein [Polaribacter sp.]
MKISYCFFFFLISIFSYGQKDSLQLGDRYAEDQLYLSISFSQFINQPSDIENDNFSYSISGGFIKDIILNNSGTIAIAGGFGFGLDYFNHDLKIEEINSASVFSDGTSLDDNSIHMFNFELPLQLRWRSSTANKYKFWRIYAGVTFLYNLNNSVDFTEDDSTFNYNDISSYRKFQYGATLTAGYGSFNINIYYGLTSTYEDALLDNETIDTKTIKMGLAFLFL